MAARGVNKVILIGHLGQDPDVRYSAAGLAWCNSSLATSERRKDNQTGEWQDHTEWHRLTFFGRTAEVAKEYLRKGSKIYVEGRLETTKYLDKKDNIERYQTKIMVSDMIMLDSKSTSAAAGAGIEDYGSVPISRPAPPPVPRSPQSMSEPPPNHHDAGFDSDVPF